MIYIPMDLTVSQTSRTEKILAEFERYQQDELVYVYSTIC